MEEIKRLLGQATRSRVKQALELQQRRFETELITLKEKQDKSGASASTTTATTTEKKPAAATATGRAYTKEITVYGNGRLEMMNWPHLQVFSLGPIGQIRQNLCTKLGWSRWFTFRSSSLQLWKSVRSQLFGWSLVSIHFHRRGFALEINNLKNINYAFKRTRLLHEIKPEGSNFKVSLPNPEETADYFLRSGEKRHGYLELGQSWQ